MKNNARSQSGESRPGQVILVTPEAIRRPTYGFKFQFSSYQEF